jgi:tetratricopeptide (TPR) repeat protein
MKKIILIILVLVCLAVYSGYLRGGFIFDDRILVEENPLIKSARMLPAVFSTGIYDYWTGQQPYDRMYRPLQMFSYYLDYSAWGLNPAGFRLSNILLHLFNSLLVFYLLFLVFKKKLLAVSAALLFLAHPVHISTVAYISARADLLSAFFILSSCVFFIKFLASGRRALYVLSLLSAGLALLSRENALLIPGFLLVAAYACGKKQTAYRYLPAFIALSLAYLVLRIALFGFSGVALHPAYNGALSSLLNFINIVCRYMLLLVCPMDLRMFHSVPFLNPLSAAALCLSLISLALFFIFMRKRKKTWGVPAVSAFGLSWFLLASAPVLFYFSAYPDLGRALMAESWLYLPAAGFCAFLAYVFLSHKKGVIIVFACALAFCGIISSNRVYWRNEIAFYERTLEFLPPGNIIMKNLAFACIESRDFAKAYAVIKEMDKYYADTPVVNAAWGRYYLARGQAGRALGYYRLILGKSFFDNYSVSLCYAKLGEFERAVRYGLDSFRQNPLFRDNVAHLSALYAEAGYPGEAEKYSLLAMQLDPKAAGGLVKE